MSRPRKQSFRCAPLGELARQLLFSPPDKRIEQVRRAEKLHDEVDAGANYPLDYLAYRLTGYRAEGKDSVLLVGEAVLPDLRLLIDTLSRSVDMPADGPAESTDELAARLHVSTKTIARWRAAGLRWRWVKPAGDGRRHIAFPRAATDRFMAAHPDRVEKASRFTPMSAADRRHLLERARRITQRRGDLSLNRVADHLARRTHRALETVRMTLEKHERDHPDDPIFATHSGPLTAQQRRVIARAYRMGVSVGRIAQRYGRTRSTIYRAIHERRAAAARRLRLDHVASPTFDRDDADEVILRSSLEPFPAGRPRTVSSVPIDDLPEPLRPLYRQPVIDDQRQRSLFIRFNYLKHKATKLRDRLDRYEPRASDLDAFSDCLGQARTIRDLLVRSNLPTVLSVARRQLVGKPDASPARLIDLLEIGNVTLIDAIDGFNAGREQTFSSFLTNKLLQQFVTVADADHAHARARRRLSAHDILRRIVDQAGESGVDLRFDSQDAEGEPPTR